MQAVVSLAAQHAKLFSALEEQGFFAITKEENALALWECDVSPHDVRKLSQSISGMVSAYYDHYCDRLLQSNSRCMQAMEGQTLREKFYALRPRLCDSEVRRDVEGTLLSGQIFAVDGYFRFSQRGLRGSAERIAARLAENLLSAREYEEFIALLTRYAAKAQSKAERVHIAMQNNKPLLLDDTFVPFYETDASEAGDKLLSALLDLAPREIYLHLEQGAACPPILETVCRIFGNRVKVIQQK